MHTSRIPALTIAAIIAPAALALFSTNAGATIVGYDIGITTKYVFGGSGGTQFGPDGNPDTGFVGVSNNGTTTFTGEIKLTGTTPTSVAFSTSTGAGYTLAPGATIWLSLNDESSNFGGYDLPAGALLSLTGTMNGVEAVALSVADRDVHSGVFKTNPYGEVLDNYILQGGDSLGRDTGDDFEVAQAPGSYRFFEAAPVPETSTSVMAACLTLVGGWGLFRRRSASV